VEHFTTHGGAAPNNSAGNYNASLNNNSSSSSVLLLSSKSAKENNINNSADEAARLLWGVGFKPWARCQQFACEYGTARVRQVVEAAHLHATQTLAGFVRRALVEGWKFPEPRQVPSPMDARILHAYATIPVTEREDILRHLLFHHGSNADARQKVEAALGGAVPTVKLAAAVLAERRNRMGMGGL